MPKNVLITPASSKIEFKDTNSVIDGLIQLDASDNLSITSPNGTLNLGNGGGTLFIGDGTNTTNVIFEQSGTLRAADTKTLTIGSSTSTTSIISPTFTGTTTIPTLTLTTADTATTASHYFVETGSDGFVRPKTIANVRTEIVTTAAVNAAAATTVGTVTSGTWQGSVISATYIDSAIARLNGPSFTGGVTITGASLADATRELRIAGVSGYIDFHNALGAGNYNGIVAANDKAILFTDGTAETGALVIAPWSAGTGGLRIDGTGRVTFGNTIFTSASTTTRAGINLPHGTAPTAPTNGDIWTTTAGLFGRINGTTQQYAPLASPTLTTPNIGAATGTSLSLTENISLGSTAQVGRLNTVDNYHAVILRGDTSDNSGTLVAQNTMAFVEFGGIWRFRQTTGTANTNVFEITTSAVTSISPFIAPAATTSIPSLRMPHGTAPTSPTNGDVWTTTAGMYVRINGATIGPLAAGGGDSLSPFLLGGM